MVYSLGKLVNEGNSLPVRFTANEADPTKPLHAQSFTVTVLPTNTGPVYVFNGGPNYTNDSNDNLDTLDGCIAILAAPTDAVEGPFDRHTEQEYNIAGINLADLWIDTESYLDGVIVSYTVG